MIFHTFQGKEGAIDVLAFRFLGKVGLIARSETKWHSGKRFKRMPIWFSVIQDGIPAIFLGKVAIGFDNRKPN